MANGLTYADEFLPVGRFVADLRARGIRLACADGKLRCTGPEHLLKGDLGGRIKARRDEILAHLSAAIPVRGTADAPLSPAQLRLWVLEQLDPEARHHIPFVLQAQGALDLDAVSRALSRIMQRHEVLRLRIATGPGGVRQRFADDATPPVTRLDARGIDPEALVRAEIARPFDLTIAPPLRLSVIDCDAGHLLVLVLHHIAADGGSVELLMAEFAALYAGADLPDLAVGYGDHAAWLAKRDHAPDMAYWRQALAGELPVTRLPGDHPRPALQDHVGALQPVAIPADLVARLRRIGADQGASLFAVLLAAFDLLIARQTGQYDLVTGIPAANRDLPETERMIGLFVNPLPIRVTLDPGLGFDAALAAVRDRLLGALDHQHVPFEQLVEAFQTRRDPGASPLFQLKFQLDRAPRQRVDLPGVTLRRLPLQDGFARHDLSLDLTETNDGVRGHLDYATALFAPETVAALAGQYLTLLAAIADDPAKPVALLDILTQQDRRDLAAWNDSAVPLDPAERFPVLFQSHAAATPDAIAVEHVENGVVTAVTYASLNARANRLAHALRAQGIGAEDVVGIALDRGPDMVAAWLGVLKSGAAYLPLDPSYPADRLAYMLGDAKARLVLSHSAIALPDVPRLDLDLGWPDGPETDPEPGTDPGDLAYVIYTSGSTGQPKGVEIPHEGLANLTRDKLRVCGPRPGDRVMGFFSFSFDASIPDLVMALGSGAALVTAPAGDVLPGPGLARIMRDRGVTHLTITPSALACLPSEELPDLRMVLVGGEAPSAELIARWSPGRKFINAYGPTECTVNASMVECGNGHRLDPTLRAPANKQLHVLDEYLEPLPPGCPGELYIAGIGLARGYRGRASQTAAVFLPNPFGPGRIYRTGDRAVRLRDGRIRLLGRVDDQVKLRGYRIEPAEIARACQTHQAVETAIVAPRGTRLVAWLVARDSRPEDSAIRAHLATRLPRHMIPDDLVWIERLPLTVNGKLDLRALPNPAPRVAQGRPPQGETETALAAIFADLLGAMPAAEDDFFELGGNSLMATRLVAAIEDRFGIAIKALTLFEAATIAALARVIDGHAAPMTEDWRHDLVLPADIRPTPGRGGLGDRVLLTGASGFVGAHLLEELLRDPARRVTCLMRQDTDLHGVFAQYGLDPSGLDRTDTIRGDLAAPGLGLGLTQPGITSILHAGASVHHLSPYRSLRDANVGGTVEILRLAARIGCPLHYLSTLSALTPADHPLTETDRAADLAPPSGGYNLTKWVAEQLVVQAAERGLAVTIHRIGSTGGNSRTGAFNPADILGRQVRGYLASGCAPAGEALINLLPVDYVARAIVTLAADPANTGRVFHLTHSAPAPSHLLFDACAAEGHAIIRIAPQDWQALMVRIAREEPDHPLFATAAMGGAQGFIGTRWPYGCTATRDALRDLREPALDEDLLRLWVRALAAALPHPDLPNPDLPRKEEALT